MKTVIAGSRSIFDMTLLEKAIAECGWPVTEVVCGCARGVDTLGGIWGEKNGIPVTHMPARWDNYGRSAGVRRNIEMLAYADAVIVLWNGHSRGSNHMIKITRAAKKPLHLVVV